MSGDVGRDNLLITALAGGSSYHEAAKAARCSLSTVRRRMADTEFRQKVAKEREAFVDALRARLVAAAPAALDALIGLLDAEGAVRLGAARALLDHALGRPRRALDFEPIRPNQVTHLVHSLIGAALDHVPDDRQLLFIEQAERICRAA